jgi:hypothetical protein
MSTETLKHRSYMIGSVRLLDGERRRSLPLDSEPIGSTHGWLRRGFLGRGSADATRSEQNRPRRAEHPSNQAGESEPGNAASRNTTPIHAEECDPQPAEELYSEIRGGVRHQRIFLSFATTIEPCKQLKASISSTSKPRCLVGTVLVGELDDYLLDPAAKYASYAATGKHSAKTRVETCRS